MGGRDSCACWLQNAAFWSARNIKIQYQGSFLTCHASGKDERLRMRILLFIGRCSTVRRGSSSSPHPLPYFSSLKISSVASSPPALLLCVLPAHLGCEPPLHGVQSIRPRHLLPANCQEAAIWSQGIYGNIGLSPLEEATALLLVLAEPRRLLYLLSASAGSSSCCAKGSAWAAGDRSRVP